MRLRLLLSSLGLTLGAILLALAAGPERDVGANYLKLCIWDCGWYTSIVESGYHSVIPPVGENSSLSNVAFFPGYPMIARGLYLGWIGSDAKKSSQASLILTAHFFCFLFWLALLLILERWKVHPYVQALVVLSFFVHPAGFFLVAGYSESMFLASMLYFFYYADHEDRKKRWFAILPGFLMTATRIVGLPVAAYPLIRYGMNRWDARQRRQPEAPLGDWRQPLLIAALSGLGCLLFLAYCQWRFGDYRLYMQTQRVGWGIVPDYGALWKWSQFQYILPYEQLATVASGVTLAGFWVAELGWAAHARRLPSPIRVPFYVCASLIFYITLCGLKSLWFRSMIRYTLPWWLLLLLCLAQLTTQLRIRPWGVLRARLALALGVCVLAVIYYFYQLPYLADFLNNRWFA